MKVVQIMNFKVFFIIFFFLFQNTLAQKKFQIIYQDDDYSTSIIADKKGKVIKTLDKNVYGINYRPETLGYFSIFSIINEKGWTAIDINENQLFQVLNTEYGTPSPDDLVENKIRIVDKNGKIGFANKKGKIIIQPKFEQASTFHNGKAIIGRKCRMIPWLEHPIETDCHHYSVKCEEEENGYINKKGKIIELGKFTFNEIANKIKWK
ncbi:WG repeat-containing protein [Chryseobacterium sp. CT-SW4]|uniref:WG repeat-containing protein n=1 Tax=Chryseobacterium sp. SW-1 TaxID=3157343 RepID=UPI003B01A577